MQGRVAAGSDADIVIWDAAGEQTVTATSQVSQCDFNVFDGLKFSGTPTVVISGGHIVVDSEGVSCCLKSVDETFWALVCQLHDFQSLCCIEFAFGFQRANGVMLVHLQMK
jgi:hypothetical protein